MRFSLHRIIDSQTVPGLHQPVSVAVDSRGNLLVCDHHREGPPTLSRLVAADGYARVVLGVEATLGVPPEIVRSGPGDSLYIFGFLRDAPREQASRAVRLSGYGVLEQTYVFPQGSVPTDMCVDRNGKLWAIFPEDSPVAMLHAYDLDGSVFFDYGASVKAARQAEAASPPAFADGQSLAVGPDGSVWFGAYEPSPDEDEEGREAINCAVNLGTDGSWRSWWFPSTFAGGDAFGDFYGLAAPHNGVLVTVAYGSPSDFGERDEFLLELDGTSRRATWHNLADDVGLNDLKARLFPSIADITYRNGLLYLCDRNQSRIIVLRVEED